MGQLMSDNLRNFSFENSASTACSVTSTTDWWAVPARSATVDPYPYNAIVVQNIGTKTAYLAWGNANTITATAPTAGGHGATPADFPIPAGAIRTLNVRGAFLAMVCAAADTTTVVFTPGYGIDS